MKIYLLHDDEKLYFEALDGLEKKGSICLVTCHVHFVKNFVKGIIRLKPRLAIKAAASFFFFIKSIFIKNSLFIAGIPPFDPAIFFWGGILKRNRVIYHTSWPYWAPDRVPVRCSFARQSWEKFIKSPNVRVVCVLPETKKELKRVYGKAEGMIDVIPHAVNTENFRPVKRANRDHLKVLFSGRLVKEKGLEDLVKVVESCKKGFFFGIAGEGRDRILVEPIMRLPNVKYYGYVKGKKAMAGIMNEYDILLLPSYSVPGWEELFGIVIIEAFACKMPVVSTDCIGPASIISNYKDGILVAQRDTSAMISTLMKLKKNRGLLRRMGDAAVKKAALYKAENIERKWNSALVKAGAE